MATATPYQQLEQEFRRLHAFRGVLALLRWDAAITMPRASADVRGDQLAALEIESHNLLIAPRISRLLDRADASRQTLAGWQAAPAPRLRRPRSRYAKGCSSRSRRSRRSTRAASASR